MSCWAILWKNIRRNLFSQHWIIIDPSPQLTAKCDFRSVFHGVTQSLCVHHQASRVLNGFSAANCRFTPCLAHVFIQKIISASYLLPIFRGSLYPLEVCRPTKCKIFWCIGNETENVHSTNTVAFLGRARLCLWVLNTQTGACWGGRERLWSQAWAALSWRKLRWPWGAGFVGPPHTPKSAEKQYHFPSQPVSSLSGRWLWRTELWEWSLGITVGRAIQTSRRLRHCRKTVCQSVVRGKAAKTREAGWGCGTTQTPERQHMSRLPARVLHQASPSHPCSLCDSCEMKTFPVPQLLHPWNGDDANNSAYLGGLGWGVNELFVQCAWNGTWLLLSTQL